MRQRSVMKHNFSEVPSASIPRSSFDRSHGHKTTFDAGYLVPFFIDEALPGDTFNLRTSGFARLATPIYPVMDNMYMETFYFSVPLRLVWDNFKKMMGEQENPTDTTDYLVPVHQNPNINWNSILDHMGLPIDVTGLTVSALPVRAYHLIWNEWFRDQNLQESIEVPKDDGPDPYGNTQMQRRGKRHDYFTSCLPWPQKGPDIELPLGETAPITGIMRQNLGGWAENGASGWESTGLPATYPQADDTTGEDKFYIRGANDDDPTGQGVPAIYADLSQATASTVNQLREAFQIQKMYERDARGGTRYTELVRSHFGVTSPDARQQRPEFLGGGSSRINITPIAQTVRDDTNPGEEASLGELGGYGTTAFQGHGFTKSFTEHSIIIGLVNVRADLTYQQGVNRMWSRRDRLDFYWPALSHLGEQEVLNKEIYAQGTSDDDLVFGYQERFAEYRYKPSTLSGRMRSRGGASLDAWHLSQDFETLPVLGPEFIEDNPPIDRVITVTQEPHFIADFHHSLKCARPMPLYGVPGNIDRF